MQLPPRYAAKAAADSSSHTTETLHAAGATARQNCKRLQSKCPAIKEQNVCCRLITFQDGKGKIGLRDKSGWGVYASVSCSLGLNVPELIEEVNNVLGGGQGVRGVCEGCATRNRTACEKCPTLGYETLASEVPAIGLLPGKSKARTRLARAEVSLWRFKVACRAPEPSPRAV